MADADKISPAQRRRTLYKACASENCEPPITGEPIFIFTPKHEIETWLKFLRDGMADESVDDLPKLPELSETYPLVDRLVEICDRNNMPSTAPPSLIMACNEYVRMRDFLKP